MTIIDAQDHSPYMSDDELLLTTISKLQQQTLLSYKKKKSKSKKSSKPKKKRGQKGVVFYMRVCPVQLGVWTRCTSSLNEYLLRKDNHTWHINYMEQQDPTISL